MAKDHDLLAQPIGGLVARGRPLAHGRYFRSGDARRLHLSRFSAVDEDNREAIIAGTAIEPTFGGVYVDFHELLSSSDGIPRICWRCESVPPDHPRIGLIR
jgi:hypothetical protein